ncbi:MAG: ATP-binding cassette domain-containing protein [Candidatus Nitronauta litoralis]|uniref:ATP-binding cassette domain-containing protein n=1 Tax=Candidatus Nitronauta litoralis TaxID=2705533 RepID=A0A7T0BWF0_9BACT|nr:MAG: ATP-binding cassette domain-containing protein [Candidatus Nitronauta litoralis]
MIEVENLTKSYGPRLAVDRLTFQVNQGEVVGFLGPNGAGKSTTMNILCSILPATSGSVRVHGHDVFENPLEVRRKIGYLPENPPLYQDMVVRDFLVFAAKIHQVPSAKIKQAVNSVIERCMLGDVRGRIIGRLSKGYQQRVGLAQAMVHDPDILILDEPTIGLDPIQIIEIRNLIRDLGKEHTILLSSHILPEVTQTCQRVIIIHEGQIAAMDTLEGLTASLNKTQRLELTLRKDAEQAVEKLNSLAPVISATVQSSNQYILECQPESLPQEEVARLVLEQGWGLESLRPVSLSLEDIFLQLTTEESEVEV